MTRLTLYSTISHKLFSQNRYEALYLLINELGQSAARDIRSNRLTVSEDPTNDNTGWTEPIDMTVNSAGTTRGGTFMVFRLDLDVEERWLKKLGAERAAFYVRNAAQQKALGWLEDWLEELDEKSLSKSWVDEMSGQAEVYGR